MSRILFSTTVCGKLFPIAVGWDRRLSECFLSIMDQELDDEDYEDERFELILEASSMGLCRNLGVSSIKAILEKAQVAVPLGVFDLLEEQVQRNAGNVIVQIDADGARKVLLDEDQAAVAASH